MLLGLLSARRGEKKERKRKKKSHLFGCFPRQEGAVDRGLRSVEEDRVK
jgi:hypothetical protein